MDKDTIICISGFLSVILLNIFITRYLIKKAITKYVKPKLESKGLHFLAWRWCGFFTFGKFNNKAEWSFITVRGDPRVSIYVDVSYRDADGIKNFTVRIDTVFMFIRKVTFSDANIQL